MIMSEIITVAMCTWSKQRTLPTPSVDNLSRSGIEQFSGTVNATLNKIHLKKFSRKPQSVQAKQAQSTLARSTQCHKCGFTWPHRDSPCPAKGRTCNKCGKLNHFARMCLTKQASSGHNAMLSPCQWQLNPKSHVQQVATQLHPWFDRQQWWRIPVHFWWLYKYQDADSLCVSQQRSSANDDWHRSICQHNGWRQFQQSQQNMCHPTVSI